MQIIGDSDNRTDFDSEKELQVNSCGWQMLRLPFGVIREKGRLDYHILLIKRGRCTVASGGGRRELGGGELVLFFPGERQEYYFTDGECVSYWIHFSGQRCRELLATLGFRAGFFKLAASEECFRTFERLILVFSSRSELSALQSSGILVDLLCQLSEGVSEKKRTAEAELLRSYIQGHYTEKIDFNQVTSGMRISLQRITQLFKARYKLSPREYKLELQLADAKFLLRYSDLQVAEIARQLGFDDEFYFSRVFRKAVGVPPSRFKGD